jgi:hypothetical protein
MGIGALLLRVGWPTILLLVVVAVVAEPERAELEVCLLVILAVLELLVAVGVAEPPLTSPPLVVVVGLAVLGR